MKAHRVAQCHPDKSEAAKGLCNSCYHKTKGSRRAHNQPPTCHPDRKHKAKGLCELCYSFQNNHKRPRQLPTPEGKQKAREYSARWRHTPEGKKSSYRVRIRHHYGISVGDFDQMLAQQGGKCAICHQSETAKAKNGDIQPLSIDHCHKTGKVRGLLCARCNTGIGMLNDDISRLTQAIAYLCK